MDTKPFITVQTIINAPVETVWKNWISPDAILKWNNASADWHTTKAENNLTAGGKFLSRMAAKDGSMSFDFEGVYDNIKTNELIEYTIADGRKVQIKFMEDNGSTKIIESFETEEINPPEIQRSGWQSILDNFKKYTEGHYDH